MRTLIIIFILFISQCYPQSSKAFFSFGGGCGNNQGLKKVKADLEDSASKNGYAMYSSFHESEGKSEDSSGPGNEKHLENELNKVIEDFEGKDCSKENCQFIMSITAHGYVGDLMQMEDYGFPRFKTEKHGLCLANHTRYDTNKLKPFLKKLKDKGVKIGLIDESCYSGHSSLLFSDVACVLTSTASSVPHALSTKSASFTTSHQKHSDGKSKQVSFERMMVEQLLNTTNYGAVQNLPNIDMPNASSELRGLNKVSENLAYRQGMAYTQKIIQSLKKLTVKEFKDLIFDCSRFYKETKGKPAEVLKKEEWFVEFIKDKYKYNFCSRIVFNKNHAKKYDDLIWNEKEKNIYREGLICEKKNILSNPGAELLANDLEGFANGLVLKKRKSDRVVPKNPNIKKYLNGLKANLSKYNFDCRFQPGKLIKQREQVRGELDLSWNFKPNDIKKNFSTTNISVFMNSSINDVEKCYKQCQKTVKNITYTSTRFDHYMASSCMNKIKAFQVLLDKVKAEKENRERGLCSQVKI